jgi:hypothetical protein
VASAAIMALIAGFAALRAVREPRREPGAAGMGD